MSIVICNWRTVNFIPLLLCLRVNRSSQCPITVLARTQTIAVGNATPKQRNERSKEYVNHLQLITFELEFLKISLDLQTALVAETHVA
jgi:hypothetical protein